MRSGTPASLKAFGSTPLARRPVLALLTTAVCLAGPTFGAEGTVEAARRSELDTSVAYLADGKSINAGPGVLHIVEGVFFATDSALVHSSEIVFLGDAALTLTPPNDVEAHQLELFTGAPELAEAVFEAVLVVCDESLLGHLLDSPLDPAPEQVETARGVFTDWKTRPHRRLTGAESAILMADAGDPRFSSYLAADLHTERLGIISLTRDVTDEEEFFVGQFVPYDLTKKEERLQRRHLRRQQRRGRLLELQVEDLGQWNTWISTPLENEPQNNVIRDLHYEMDVTLNEYERTIDGTVDIEVLVQGGAVRVIDLVLYPDLRVRSVKLDGSEIPFHRKRFDLLAFLPETVEPGTTLRLTIDYGGVILNRVDPKIYVLRDPLNWYPRVAGRNPATYEVVFHRPKSYDFFASGVVVESQREKVGMIREERILTTPSRTFSFEIGEYDIETLQVGHVSVRFGFLDYYLTPTKRTLAIRDQIIAAVADSLAYYETFLGPYPHDHLEVVMVPRSASQGLSGFISLSTTLFYGSRSWNEYLGAKDRRAVVAHEVAHQWWGHVVSTSGYRDHWLDEALANYSSVSWAKTVLGKSRSFRGATSLWKPRLFDQLGDGRTIESLGPITLGHRLDSTRSDSAYYSIVYRKGAVVLNMLSEACGEDAFVKGLRAVIQKGIRNVSTEEFFRTVQDAAGCELDLFLDQYVYGTGVREVDYTYDFNDLGDGKWSVTGSAVQHEFPRYHDVLVHREEGLDVVRHYYDPPQTEIAPLAVPFRIDVIVEGSRRKKSGVDKKGISRDPFVSGKMVLYSRQFDFEIELEHQPKRMWLDYYEEVFGRFHDGTRFPMKMLFRRGQVAAARGQVDEALSLFRRALQAGYPPELQNPDETAASVWEGRIRVETARLHTDRGEYAAARRELKAIPGPYSSANWRSEERLALELRLDILEGSLAGSRALNKLKSRMNRWGSIVRGSTLTLLAIAATQTDDMKTYDTASEYAEWMGMDLSLLRETVGEETVVTGRD